MISSSRKATLLKQYGRSKTDVGSPEAQVAVLTERIQEVNQHLKTAKKDKMAQRGLLQMVGKRRRLLAYLARRDVAAYQDLIKKLKLRK
ncbi:30S ribosomal protein S15 [Candidatus Saccharibacteria bacterium]|nr:30S ribosomal protein S15 [Candidatus Saccharibacteria bacterium]